MVGNLQKKLLLLLNDIKSDGKQGILLSVLLFLYTAYLGSRTLDSPLILIIWLFSMYYASLIICRPNIRGFFTKNQSWLIFGLAILLLIWSLLYHRADFGDGPNLYFRNAYLVAKKGYSTVLQGAPSPYLAELLLGLVRRFFGHNIMTLFFGFASLAGIYTSYLLYKELNLNGFIIKSSLIILAFSPTYIMLSVREFKVELFLLFITNLFLLFVIRAYKRPTLVLFMFLGLLAGISFLIKLSVIPLVFFAPLVLAVLLVKNNAISVYRVLSLLVSFFFTFFLAIVLWLLYTPTELPIVGKIDFFRRSESFADLERDQNVLSQCRSESSQRDFSSWIYYKDDLWLLIQPFQYLFLLGFYLNKSIITIANPGLFLYFGLWLFPFATYLLYKRNNIALGYTIYIVCLPFIMILYYLSKTAFWYLFPAYPVLATSIPILADQYLKTRPSRDLFKFLIISLSFVHLIFGYGLVYVNSLLSSGTRETKPKDVIYEMSKKAQELAENHYILDATQHVYITVLPFMENYDKRLVKSDFYFASSGKDVDQMRSELLGKNIKYVIARKRELFDEWYIGCPLRNNEVLFQFLEKHTRMIYDSNYTGEIYEIL